MLTLSACTGPDDGSIESAPDPDDASQSSDDSAFSMEQPEDVCPKSEILPSEHLAPAGFSYEDTSENEATDIWVERTCTFELEQELGELDGLQGLSYVSITFQISDGTELQPIGGGFSPFQPSDTGSSDQFPEWDSVARNFETDWHKSGLEDSDYYMYEIFGSIDNLYVYGSVGRVFLFAGHTQVPDAETYAVGYETAMAVITQMLDQLEHE